jgi:hypothetical protein
MGSELDIVAVATELVYTDLTVGDSTEAMPGYAVDWVFGDQWANTGFYAAGFANEAEGRRILAVRGSQDRLDIIADAELGLRQYLRNRDPLLDYVGSHILGNSITIAGHSLGGCLSQYLGYDSAMTYSQARENLTIHTHNGLGGVLGLTRMNGRKLPSDALEGVAIRNYRHPADPVSRLGGQLGGKVFALRLEGPFSGGLRFIHSNKRFQPARGRSALEQVVEGRDETFGISGTLTAAGPELSKALDAFLEDHQSFAAARELFEALRAVPKDERGAVLGIAADLLPFRQGIEQLVSRLRRPSSN